MKKVLVTGANGYIGRYCVDFLLAKGFEVHGVSRTVVPEGNIRWHQIDLLNESAEDLLKNLQPDFLLHLAWVTEHGQFWSAESNHQWLDRSLELMKSFYRNGGQRFVSSGSVAEYEWNNENCEEGKSAEDPHSLYGQCKKAFTDQLLEHSKSLGKSAAVGRVFFLYGPGEPETRLIPSVIRSALKGDAIQCTDGEQVRDFMYVTDVAEALVALLDSDVDGRVNIASGNPLKLKDIISQAHHQADSGSPIEFGARPRPEGDPDRLTASTRRLFIEVGFTPKVSLKEGLQKTINAFKESADG